MVLIVTSIFSSLANAAKKEQLYHRQVNLSGNIFHFSMPEDFSKDMPAKDLVERLDISDIELFTKPENGNLIRRWWDIKEPKWFGKNLGSVMMDISVQRVAENRAKRIHESSYNIADRLDFMLMLDDLYHQRYDDLNKTLPIEPGRTAPYHSSLLTIVGGKIYSTHNEHVTHGQKWLKQSIAGPRGTLIVNYAIPLNKNVFLNASFTYSPNDGVSTRELLDVAQPKVNGIDQSFEIVYAPNNEMAKVVSADWLLLDNDEVLNQRRNEILKLFYGPEKALLQQERNDKGARLKDDSEM